MMTLRATDNTARLLITGEMFGVCARSLLTWTRCQRAASPICMLKTHLVSDTGPEHQVPKNSNRHIRGHCNPISRLANLKSLFRLSHVMDQVWNETMTTKLVCSGGNLTLGKQDSRQRVRDPRLYPTLLCRDWGEDQCVPDRVMSQVLRVFDPISAISQIRYAITHLVKPTKVRRTTSNHVDMTPMADVQAR